MFEAIGFGNTNWNGVYSANGTYGGKTLYQNTNLVWLYWANSRWNLDINAPSVNATMQYYQSGTTTDPTTGTWNPWPSGSPAGSTPAGLFSVYSPDYPPTVDTSAATSVTDVSALLHGEITDVGVDNCDERGFVWDLDPQSDPGDVAPGDSEYAHSLIETGDFSAETFLHITYGLSPSTTYYFRAYAHNSDGYAYGPEISFATEAVPPWRFENIGDLEMKPEDHQTIWAERLNEILDRLHDLDNLEPS